MSRGGPYKSPRFVVWRDTDAKICSFVHDFIFPHSHYSSNSQLEWIVHDFPIFYRCESAKKLDLRSFKGEADHQIKWFSRCCFPAWSKHDDGFSVIQTLMLLVVSRVLSGISWYNDPAKFSKSRGSTVWRFWWWKTYGKHTHLISPEDPRWCLISSRTPQDPLPSLRVQFQ